ncbi:gluconolactonase [Catenovulum agarivorans DS-2]|uniref:Gluconolactonase n=1 Tax=Catenovulum agarivorans DS-2 TaxID=1328313 RepID=W7QA02_9ALTE|nr:SMP-30/gluconolactonase/LRE family protein [Catenovulum agarivorans]EWH08821.1 gluconolactonase [Catenovulum agarivorans DS-2]
MSTINKFNSPIKKIGQQLTRPECVLTNAKGEIYVSDFRGGITQINPDGSQVFYGGEYPGFGLLQTNGFAMLKDGSFLIAHLGADKGGIFRLKRDNSIEAFLLEIDGEALPPSNFVYLDQQNRIWITVSTRTQPRAAAYKPTCNDGFIILIDQHGARIVADGLGYTNECWVNPEGTELYANATFSRELLKFDIAPNGDLCNQTVVCKFAEGTFPDGLTRDTQGNFWVTSIVSNRVIKVSENGEQELMLEISDDQHVNKAEAAFQNLTMGRPHLDNNPAELKNISSLAFAGAGLNKIILGCLLDKQIYQLGTEFTGVKPAHWYF